MRKIKLIWDFRGPNALHIAKHHEIHLKEYIAANKLSLNISGFQSLNNNHFIAFMVVNADEMKPVRDMLKPHRGQIYDM